ncbi:MAG: hypothetical protein KAT65_25495, partial [Methanophagales archaeon]|nr:hypothetical protein [Methanophagales archaeon]
GICRNRGYGGLYLEPMNYTDNDNRDKLEENLEKVQQIGVEDVKYVSFKEAGVNLGRLANIWEMGYLSGRKV